MEWFKVKVSYCLYSDLNDKQFSAYVKLMALTAQIEEMPTRQQMLKICHYKTLTSLEEHFNRGSIDLQEVLNKVLIDVQQVSNKKTYWKEAKQKNRASKQIVHKDIQEKSHHREEKRREDKIKNKPKEFWSYHKTDSFKGLFSDYIEMRKAIKSKMTDKAIELAISKLDKYDEQIACKMLEQSIMNSWKGLFEVDNGNNKGQTANQGQPRHEIRRPTLDFDIG